MQNKELITINQATQILGVSLDTLRRWDKSGKLPAVRLKSSGHRYYDRNLLAELMPNLDIYKLALKWASGDTAVEPLADFYCPNSSIFQARLSRLETELIKSGILQDRFSLITSVVGEIGNNAYDHNLGNWPDVPGVFFIYNLNNRQLAIADRGQGVLTTLRKVRPDLKDDQDAVKMAFTEIISGRAPESRGNGLKFVRKIVAENKYDFLFKSGQAELRINKKSHGIDIAEAKTPVNGCLALVKF
ncbi:MAG: helix-turn-helix domain-containing protein [Patescibacteria group bacterium]|jgi:excisionase family DNA binding protein